MKKIMLSILVVGTTLFASNNAPIYKTGLLLAPKGDVIYK
ncbi:MAG: cytochrome C, partial [Campylobacteraceae bacterium]|nr:cytochrome C [Campylobacteraceae bacterium]